MNVSDDNKKYFLLYLLCLVILFSVFVFEIPFLRWQNYDYWWIDFRNESLGNSFRSAILNLSPLDFNFDLGFDVGSTHLFPFSLPLILSPKYGVIVSNLIVLFLSFYVVVYVLERLWVTRYEAIVVSSLIFFYPAPPFSGLALPT